MSSTFKHTHPNLGPLTGLIRSSSTVQFRNVSYATVPGRFRQCIPIETLTEDQRNCTIDGYISPQNVGPPDAFGGPLPCEREKQFDEFRCLTLVISAPKKTLENDASKLLPVMVYVHGGAFFMGSHVGAVYDTVRMSDLAVQEDKPVVIVSIHYRLGWTGFLACQDLVAEAEKNGEAPCNFGLHDQRAAFLWIQKHISGFGGDASNITAFGESAGSVSLSLHIDSTVPLFKRAILQSGTSATNAPADLSVREKQYRELLHYCDINEHDPNRLELLRKVPVQKLVEAIDDLNFINFGTWAEPGFFPVTPNYYNQVELMEKCDWVKEIIIGDGCFEGFNFNVGLKDVTIESLIIHLQKLVGVDDAQKILEAYSISEGMDRNLFWKRIMTFGGDMVFSEPTHALAYSLAARRSKTVYRYNVALRNPFPGSMFSEVAGHHFIDLLYLFMTLLERYPSEILRSASTEFARRWITFANGLAPWKEYTIEEQSIAVVDGIHGWVTRNRKEDVMVSKDYVEGGRRYEAWETVDGVLQKFGKRAPAVQEQMKAKYLITLAKK